MTAPTDLAAALLRDVTRFNVTVGDHTDPSFLMLETEVLAALSRALDPALAERAGEVLERLQGPHEWGYRDPVSGDFLSDESPFNAANLITALLAQNAALRAERDRYFNSGCRQMQEIADLLVAKNTAEAERDAAIAAMEAAAIRRGQAEAEVEKLRAERDALQAQIAKGNRDE